MEEKRYSRQEAIHGFKQNKLRDAKVVVIGLGGLGTAASVYLARAGIGYIRLIDHDIVSMPDLNRQILYGEDDIERKKVEVAKEKLQLVNSEIEIEAIDRTIKEENAIKLLKGVDAILDCTDNFSTRYLLNKMAVMLGIPLFFASCREMQGMATVVLPRKTACIKCIFSDAPETKENPILGSIAGTMGTIQATEVIKFFVGMPLLANKLLLYDAQFNRYDVIEVEKKKDCPVCGAHES